MRKLFVILGIVSFVILLHMVATRETGRKIAINQFVSHPALDEATRGIQVAIKERLGHGVSIQVQNAQGSIVSAVQIAQQQVSNDPDVIIGVATPSAQASLKARTKAEKMILAFVAITDPKDAGLEDERNIVGVSDAPPIEDLLQVIKKAMPEKKRIGVIFNPGEIGSVKIVKMFQKSAESEQFDVSLSAVHSTSNIKLAVERLMGKVDVIFVPLDNMVVSGIQTIAQTALTHGVPIVGNDPSLVDSGLLFAVGCDYFKSGEQLGQMLSDILLGQPVQQKIQLTNFKEYKINESTAKALGMDMEALRKAYNE
ncbi:ABC transporter substrate-binding protein [Rickettsiales endosymbiont of Peranema trichophorum]|uniref:ABC transporter substrate-binding protein n=1 Tax=Rickettsiales endosymbiont of Peranema trichophorum TaxID=2486577 RepID=UPI001022E286|nr:ABC transporter substrate-binding protein [Rickettsiales endosymbiont of Peranema trichophorum]RZI47366.1 ABC transporter substrate-binding protein [Rickettsiales endosymbiont of Peranema trichophorum]